MYPYNLMTDWSSFSLNLYFKSHPVPPLLLILSLTATSLTGLRQLISKTLIYFLNSIFTFNVSLPYMVLGTTNSLCIAIFALVSTFHFCQTFLKAPATFRLSSGLCLHPTSIPPSEQGSTVRVLRTVHLSHFPTIQLPMQCPIFSKLGTHDFAYTHMYLKLVK